MIGPTGIWSDAEVRQSGYPKSVQLAKNLARTFSKDQCVVDFGCGDAFYINWLKTTGFTNVVGIDGHLPFKSDYTFEFDLSKPHSFPFSGQVLSLEVGEHIPHEFEDTFISNLCSHCASRMVISWAVPDQPGLGHVNCRENEYIIDLITRYEFTFNLALTKFLRDDIEHGVSYFRNTIMVFDRK